MKTATISEGIALIRGSTDYSEEFLPRSIQVQNQKQFSHDSVAIRSTGSSTETTIVSFLERYRWILKKEWYDSCVSDFSDDEKERFIMRRFLFSDMKLSCFGVLPPNVHTLPSVDLPGPIVLQVNEIANILFRSKDSSRDRCLMLTMTDGAQRIYGFEHRPITDLEVSATAGFKVLIHNANVRGGVLMLVPENMKILGGMVEDLEAARKKSSVEVHESTANACDAVADDSTLLDAILSRSSIQAIGGQFSEIVIDNSNKLTAEDKGIDCTYLVNLFEVMLPKMMDDTSVIRCKIQGIMTGLGEFKYEGRTEYELLVCLNDGSCTSDVYIHHNLVQRQIGLTPKQVNAYLSSPNKKIRQLMKDAMAEYLISLSTLRCTLVVVMHKSSPFPVAVEIDSSINDGVFFEGLKLLKCRSVTGRLASLRT